MNTNEILIKEYEALRAEILLAMTSRNTILSYGLAVIGVLYSGVAAMAVAKVDTLLPSIVLMLVVPSVCLFSLFIWLGEYQRMHRAAGHIINLEGKILCNEGKKILTWETNLRENKKHMRYPYDTTILMLVLISVFSQVTGYYLINDVGIWILIVSLAPLIVVYIYAISRMTELRNQ